VLYKALKILYNRTIISWF